MYAEYHVYAHARARAQRCAHITGLNDVLRNALIGVVE